MEKEQLLQELKEQFDSTKKQLGFKSSYKEINEMSYIEDLILAGGYVSNQFSRQLINRMVETFHSWINSLYSWIYPAPMDIVHMNESKKLSKEERKEMLFMIDRIMYLVRKNKRIAFGGLIKNEEADFIDELVEFNKKYFSPFMLKYNKKFEDLWKEEFSKTKNIPHT